MIKTKSRTNSPFKLNQIKNQYIQNYDLNCANTQSQGINYLYSPQDDIEGYLPYTKKKVTPLSSNKTKRNISTHNQSFENETQHLPFKFSSEADLTNSMIPFQKREDLKSQQIQNRLPVKQFVLKKIDLQKIHSNQQQHIDLRNLKLNGKVSISPKLNQPNIAFKDMIQIRGSMNGLRQTNKSKRTYDSSQTTDDFSDEIECAENLLKQIKIQENLDHRSLSQPMQKIKSIRLSEDVDEISEDESEEEYNIWPNNTEVLMRGIDFENFTDNQNQPLYPQVIYKVRNIFYNQFQQINSEVTKQTKQNKQPNQLSQTAFKDVLEYIPNDKKIQQDFQILKEFASCQKRRNRRNQERVSSPKKFKNHFIVQMEREKFFQNMQIHQSINQTPQFIAFQQYFNKYHKVEQMKQKPAKYQRYPISSLTHIETQQSISKRIKSCSSNQETPRNHNNNLRNKQKNSPNFSQMIGGELHQLHSPLLQQERQDIFQNQTRCASNIKSRVINSMNNHNNSVHLYKYMKQGNLIKQDIFQQKPKQFKKQYNTILKEIVVQSKFD